MNDVLNTSFFGLFAEPSQEVTNKEMQNAYAQFIVHMETVSNSDDYANIFRMLNHTRIEMTHLQTVSRHEQGEKCPEIRLSSKSVNTCRF